MEMALPLMKLGVLATIGFYQPSNLLHIILDNEAHDSTGGQPNGVGDYPLRGRRPPRLMLPFGFCSGSPGEDSRGRSSATSSTRTFLVAREDTTGLAGKARPSDRATARK